MRKWINWFRRESTEPETSPAPTLTTTEWHALEKALREHDFSRISPAIRAWGMQSESRLEPLQEAARLAGFNTIEVNKIEILFEYYAGKMEIAFNRAQMHIKEHGFDPDLHVISLVTLYQNNQFEAAHAYQKGLNDTQAAQMNRVDYWQMVSIIRWANNDMANLENVTDRALTLAPNDSAVLQTSLAIYIELGLTEKVTAVRTKLAQLPHGEGYAHSLSLLALGEHEKGWRLMEGRYELHDAHRYINQGLKSIPRWQGAPLADQRLLLSAEQGLGDTIQMARYLPLLQSMGAKQVALETQPETLTLLQYNFPEIPLVERQWAQAPALDFDLWTGMMSLPYLLKAWGNNIPGRGGYLSVPPDNNQYWNERVAQSRVRKQPCIGLAWSGQPMHRADRRRSVPFELMMRHVRKLPFTFFALQTHVPQGLPGNVVNVSDEMITLADTAALIAQMDLVITVDTSVVHISGALGKETWLLLPKRYEWRWGLEGESNDWYDTVKVIRQTEHANWEQVLRDVFDRRVRERFQI